MARTTCFAAVAAIGGMLLAPGLALAWGALAISQTPDGEWSYGLTWDAASRAEAMQSAMAQCRDQPQGAHCRLVTTFSGLCIGVAFRNGGNGYGWATRQNDREARAAAHQSCLDSNPSCKVVISRCDRATTDDPGARGK